MNSSRDKDRMANKRTGTETIKTIVSDGDRRLNLFFCVWFAFVCLGEACNDHDDRNKFHAYDREFMLWRHKRTTTMGRRREREQRKDQKIRKRRSGEEGEEDD